MDENQNNEMPQEGENMPEAEQPMPEGMPEPQPEGKSGSYGPIVGILIIVVLLIFAGFYFWGDSLNSEMPEVDNTEEVPTAPEGEAMEEEATEVPLSDSDELDALEAELEGTILEDIDAELEDIDAELNF